MTEANRRFRWLWWSLGAMAALGVALAGGHLAMRWAEPTALAQEARPQPRGDGEQAAVRVVVVRPRKGEMDRTTSQPGTVQAFESVQIFAGVSGYLKTLNVDIGDTIRRGQSLATVDVPELEKEVQRRARPGQSAARPDEGARGQCQGGAGGGLLVGATGAGDGQE